MYNKRIFKRCFSYPKRYWYKNLKHIPLYFKLIHHLMKYGYDEYAAWETFDWFIHTMSAILKQYKKGHLGVPIIIGDYPFDSTDDSEDAQKKRNLNDKLWEMIIDEMIDCLADMDENNPKYDNIDDDKQYELMEAAKTRFFELFSRHFYDLWD